MRDFRIEIKSHSLEDIGKEFSQVWKDAEQGKAPKTPKERVSFEDLKSLVQVLTPKRLEALTYLYEHGPLAIRALAKSLHRNYKNVYQDIQILERTGLVEETETGLVSAPYDKIIAEIKIAA